MPATEFEAWQTGLFARAAGFDGATPVEIGPRPLRNGQRQAFRVQA
jgi:hypothetical protein